MENKYVDALFGDFLDAYTVLRPGPDSVMHSTTSLDANDVALVLTEEDGLQLFLPANGEINDTGLAIIEVYNALCRDRAGMVDKNGVPVVENHRYQGFIKECADRMKALAGEETDD